jgi:hypothetical protein
MATSMRERQNNYQLCPTYLDDHFLSLTSLKLRNVLVPCSGSLQCSLAVVPCSGSLQCSLAVVPCGDHNKAGWITMWMKVMQRKFVPRLSGAGHRRAETLVKDITSFQDSGEWYLSKNVPIDVAIFSMDHNIQLSHLNMTLSSLQSHLTPQL